MQVHFNVFVISGVSVFKHIRVALVKFSLYYRQGLEYSLMLDIQFPS